MKSRYDQLESGLIIHSYVAGDESLPPLVLLHGYPVSAYLWRDCIPFLSEHFRVFAPDLPGHGKSGKPLDVDYDLDLFMQFLNQYYDAVNIKKAHLAVHDLGGIIGLPFASRCPEKISRFVVMDTLPYTKISRSMKQFYDAVRCPIFSRIMLLKRVFMYTFFRDKKIVFNPKKISRQTAEYYHSHWKESKDAKKAFSKVLKVPIENFTEPAGHLKNIKAPTLIIWAENDQAIDKKVGEQLAQDIPGADLKIVSECGHFLPEEQPEEVSRLMLDFLLK